MWPTCSLQIRSTVAHGSCFEQLWHKVHHSESLPLKAHCNVSIQYVLYMRSLERGAEEVLSLLSLQIQMRKPWECFAFVLSICFEHQYSVLLCGQFFHLSIAAFPAVGVPCEWSPAFSHWFQAGTGGVSQFLQWLTWCSAEAFILSSLSLLFFSPAPNLKSWGQGKPGFTYAQAWMAHLTHSSIKLAFSEVYGLVVSFRISAENLFCLQKQPWALQLCSCSEITSHWWMMYTR